MFKLLKKKTETEKEISKLNNKLFNIKKKRDFLLPRVNNSFFRKDIKIETVSENQMEKIIKYDKEIISIKKKLAELDK